jgi:hypothetical protein
MLFISTFTSDKDGFRRNHGNPTMPNNTNPLLSSLKSADNNIDLTIFIFDYFKIRAGVAESVLVSDYGLDDRSIGFDPLQGQRIFPLASVSRPALGPTQAPGPFPRAKSGRDVTLNTLAI